ncbi:MAG: sugar ABC transporter permease [Clostridia bacterium]|nr:sugar ABC transporter permease [Clostridia bacterium]
MADLSKLQEITRKRKWYEIGHYSADEKRYFPVVYLLLIIPVLHLIVFYFYVNFSSFALAFTDRYGDFTLGNFEAFLTTFFSGGVDSQGGGNPSLSLRNSLIIYWIGFIVGNSVGLITTYMLTMHIAGSKFFRVCLHVPGLIGGVVSVSINQGLLAYDGPITQVIFALFGKDNFNFAVQDGGLLAHESTAFLTLLIWNQWGAIGGGGMVLAGAFKRIPQEVFEAASLDGCGFLRETFQIAVPCAWPTISTSLIFGFCGMFTADLNFYLYSGGQNAHGMTSMGSYLYRYQALIAGAIDAGGNYDWLYGYVSAAGMIITAITVPCAFLGRYVLSKFIEDVSF